MNKHCFALWYGALESLIPGHSMRVTDRIIVHRVLTILKLKPHDTFILFNQTHHALLELIHGQRAAFEARVHTYTTNAVLTPAITVLLPLLKRAALEEALAMATATGANTIQLITTHKTHMAWHGTKERERLERIIIAAAEQSKHFAYPTLLAPQPLLTLTPAAHERLISADQYGHSLKTILEKLIPVPAGLTLAIGPEGDWTDDERTWFDQHQADRIRLTPTTLRSEHAVGLFVGIMRSLL